MRPVKPRDCELLLEQHLCCIGVAIAAPRDLLNRLTVVVTA